METQNKVGVILTAGGMSRRMGTSTPKQFLEIGGRALFTYSLDTFTQCNEVAEIVFVVPQPEVTRLQESSYNFSKTKVTAGGETRWQSVRQGFKILSPDINRVLIHDAARPFINPDTIHTCIAKIGDNNAVVPGLLAQDTLKEISGENIVRTVDRTHLIQTQTPQGFPRMMLEKIYQQIDTEAFPPDKLTDEAGMAEYLEFPVTWFEGSEKNKKVTRKEDLAWAEWMSHIIEKESSKHD